MEGARREIQLLHLRPHLTQRAQSTQYLFAIMCASWTSLPAAHSLSRCAVRRGQLIWSE